MNANDVYELKADAVSDRIARGWHCFGPVAQFDDGTPHMVEAFHTKLVVFRTQDGQMAALNNFCPHMGASLADGRVRGNAIACPFHDWRWGPDGRCTEIPYARRIPPRARIKAWDLKIVDEVLYIWYDPEGNAPYFDLLPIPDFDTAFSDWSYTQHRIAISPRELVDNLVDVAHFFYVHGQGVNRAVSFFGNRFEGQTAWQFLEGSDNPKADYDVMQFGVPVDRVKGRRTETCYNGPSYLRSRTMFELDGDMIEGFIVLGQQPIDPENFILHMLITVRERPDLSSEDNRKRTELAAHYLRTGTLQDVHIWETKARIDNPLLCDGDGPVYQLRRWYQQFFVDASAVRDEMTDCFENITDTSYSFGVWERQAVENRAERAAEQQAAE